MYNNGNFERAELLRSNGVPEDEPNEPIGPASFIPWYIVVLRFFLAGVTIYFGHYYWPPNLVKGDPREGKVAALVFLAFGEIAASGVVWLVTHRHVRELKYRNVFGGIIIFFELFLALTLFIDDLKTKDLQWFHCAFATAFTVSFVADVIVLLYHGIYAAKIYKQLNEKLISGLQETFKNEEEAQKLAKRLQRGKIKNVDFTPEQINENTTTVDETADSKNNNGRMVTGGARLCQGVVYYYVTAVEYGIHLERKIKALTTVTLLERDNYRLSEEKRLLESVIMRQSGSSTAISSQESTIVEPSLSPNLHLGEVVQANNFCVRSQIIPYVEISQYRRLCGETKEAEDKLESITEVNKQLKEDISELKLKLEEMMTNQKREPSETKELDNID